MKYWKMLFWALRIGRPGLDLGCKVPLLTGPRHMSHTRFDNYLTTNQIKDGVLNLIDRDIREH
jgi:hypothetical protein